MIMPDFGNVINSQRHHNCSKYLYVIFDKFELNVRDSASKMVFFLLFENNIFLHLFVCVMCVIAMFVT